MKPIKNKILAEVIENQTNNSGIILMGDDGKRHHAKVLAVGPVVEKIKVGDIIDYNIHEAIDYELEGKKCIFITESGTLFVV